MVKGRESGTSSAAYPTWDIRSEKAAVKRIEYAFTGCRWMCTEDTFEDVNMCSQDNLKINGSF